MKDGRTHLAHKAEHAVDMDTGAIVAVTIQGADQGDTTTISETLREAGDPLDKMMASAEAGPRVYAEGLTEVVADEGHHSDQTLTEMEALGLRPYVSEPARGRRKWKDDGARPRCTPIGAARAVSADAVYSVDAENERNGRLLTCARREECDGLTSAAARTS